MLPNVEPGVAMEEPSATSEDEKPEMFLNLNEGIEKKIETTTMGYIRTAIMGYIRMGYIRTTIRTTMRSLNWKNKIGAVSLKIESAASEMCNQLPVQV